MAAKRKRRSGAKIVTKREQSELLEHLERLGEDPSILVPATNGAKPRALAKLDRRVRKIARLKGKRGALRRRLKMGPAFTRAFANLMLVRQSGKAERMGSYRSPVGELKYAVRGNVSPRHIVAIQHFRYPEVRVLGYRELAQESRGIVWSTEDGVAWTPRRAPPPEAWFDLLNSRLPLEMTRDEGRLLCPHMVDVENVHAPDAPYGLEVDIDSAGLRARICEGCIREHFAGRSTSWLATMARTLIGVNASRDIVLTPTGTPTRCQHTDPCAWTRHLPNVGQKTLERYLAGGANEGDVLDSVGPRWTEAVQGAGEPLYVAGELCFGADRDAFLDALKVNEATREALGRFLNASPPVVIAAEPSVNKVLDACWDAAPKVLADLHPDRGELDALLARHARSPHATVLEEVLEARQASTALAGFPTYRDLQGGAGAANALARAHKVGGNDGMVAAADRELKRSTHKGVVYAALRIADATQGREWQFHKTDTEAGEFLEDALRRLLEAGPGDYHERLAEIHTLSGGSGELPKPSG